MNAKMNEIAKMHAANGVIIIDPCNTYIDETVKIAPKAKYIRILALKVLPK